MRAGEGQEESQRRLLISNILHPRFARPLTNNAFHSSPSLALSLKPRQRLRIIRKAPHLRNLLSTSSGRTSLSLRMSNLLTHVPFPPDVRRVVLMAPKLLTFTKSGLNEKVEGVNEALKTTVYKPVGSWDVVKRTPEFLVKQPQVYYLKSSTVRLKILAYQLVLLFGSVPSSPRGVSGVIMHRCNGVLRDAFEGTPGLLLVGWGPISRVEWTWMEGFGKRRDLGGRRKRRRRSEYLKANPGGSVGDMLREEGRNREVLEGEVGRKVREWVEGRDGGGGERGNVKVALMGRSTFRERYGWEGEVERGKVLKEEVERYYETYYKGGGENRRVCCCCCTNKGVLRGFKPVYSPPR